MARIRLLLVTVILALGSASASCCYPPRDLPVHFNVDSRFEGERQARVGAGVDPWNAVGREYLGIDQILINDGPYADPDGFDPNDLADGRHVIYRGSNDAYYRETQASGNTDPLGEGTHEDVIIWDFRWQDRGYAPEQDLNVLTSVTMHELGHFLLTPLHVMDDPQALMSSLLDWNALTDHTSAITRRDIEYFCRVYDCIKQP